MARLQTSGAAGVAVAALPPRGQPVRLCIFLHVQTIAIEAAEGRGAGFEGTIPRSVRKRGPAAGGRMFLPTIANSGNAAELIRF